MKNISSAVILLTLLIQIASPSFAQNNKNKKQQAIHQSSIEKKTLTNNSLPVIMPYNRWIDPAGEQIYFGDSELENHALDCALSPDGKWIAVEGRYSVVIISTKDKKVVTRFDLEEHFEKENVKNTFSGINWRKQDENYQLYWSASGNAKKSYVIKAEWNNQKLEITKTFEFLAVAPARTALPNEILITEESGITMLYVVLNGNNTLEKLNESTGETIWSKHTGVAPYGIAKANDKIYVTNWAGSVPDKSDKNVAGVPWGSAKIDPKTGATREGTVSVFDPKSGNLLKEIIVGLHPNDIISAPDEKIIYVANANSDNISAINTNTDILSETISVRLGAENNPYWGDSPNGLAILGDGETLFVANGMDNAVAVVELGNLSNPSSTEKQSKTVGFIPTGAYPGAVCIYNNLLFIANIEAEGARIPFKFEASEKPAYNSHHMMASISVIPIPNKNRLTRYTKKVKETNQFFRIALSKELPQEDATPVPVPLRIGEPSVFKHVVYIIKENRTYDQVLGDHKKGDGDPSLCIFGKEVTPNTHKICDEFLLLDNFYASGKSSAEGHQWTDMAIVPDYVEKNVRGWFRSYPHVQQDAMVYAPTGFIWDNALRHGKSVRIYGEACVPKFNNNETWTSIYKSFKNGEDFEFTNITTIKTVHGLLSHNYPGYDNHKIPDILRAESFIKELNEYESKDGDQWPELLILALPNDHAAGTRPGFPTPRAMVADNDLALGQIIEAITKSKFWENTVIFVTEDDSQAGWDHVSAYRTVGLVISPFSRLNKTVRTNYNQVSLVRTIEQILGISPMNIMDATAMPMFNCFTNVANNSPFNSVLNEIPLDEMNKDLSELKGTALYFAKKSLEPQFDKVDAGDDDLLNRIIWSAANTNRPYPAKFSGKDNDDDDD